MSRNIAVIPFQARDQHRVANLSVVKNWASSVFDEVIVAESTVGSVFNRSQLINKGVSASCLTGNDVVCITDADIILSNESIQAAAKRARRNCRLVYPYNRLKYLTEQETKEFRLHEVKRWMEQGAFDREQDLSGGSIFLSKETWDRSGGMDEDFFEYGCEDTAFRKICRETLGPEYRHEFPAIHLWHPVNENRPAQNYELLNQRYGMNYDVKQLLDLKKVNR